jgi:predicted PurR-regulated permease PerM
MIRPYLTALLLAAIFSGMSAPLHLRMERLLRGRRSAASVVTVLLVLAVIVIPLTAFFGVVAAQAVQVTQSVAPWIEQKIREPGELDRLLEKVPFFEQLEPHRDKILAKIGEVASRVGTFLVGSVANMTKGTVGFLLNLFIMLYAMFFFLTDGRAILQRILYYMPLGPEDERRLVDRFVSVTRATLKGTLVIGIVQGGLAGLSFWVFGVGSPAFWGTVMAVLSIIPGIGAALIWVPAVGYLFALGKPLAAIGLLVWCGAVVGTADNFLRPRLVGRDTKMPDLLVLLGTLGGLVLFGAVGIVIGPIVAALFLTVWDLYGKAFEAYLPETAPEIETP